MEKRLHNLVGAKIEEVFKTLVLENSNHEHYVFVIPVNETLDDEEGGSCC